MPNSSRFCRPVRSSSTEAYWPVRPMVCRTRSASRTTSKPLIRAVPASGVSRVERMRTAVVLPAPLGPSTPSTVPAGHGEVHALQRPRLPEVLHEALGLDHQVSCHAPSLRGPADTAPTRHRHRLTAADRCREGGRPGCAHPHRRSASRYAGHGRAPASARCGGPRLTACLGPRVSDSAPICRLPACRPRRPFGGVRGAAPEASCLIPPPGGPRPRDAPASAPSGTHAARAGVAYSEAARQLESVGLRPGETLSRYGRTIYPIGSRPASPAARRTP